MVLPLSQKVANFYTHFSQGLYQKVVFFLILKPQPLLSNFKSPKLNSCGVKLLLTVIPVN